MKRILVTLVALIGASAAYAQTPSPTQVGITKSASPYPLSIQLNGAWYPWGTITSGGVVTVNAAALPLPTSSTIGGVKSFTGTTSQWPWQLNTDGSWTLKQPTISDIANLPEVWINAYGADPTGVSDNCSAWTAALAAIPAPNGGTIRFSAGNYKFASCALTVANRHIRISGAGPGSTFLNFPNAGTGGISVSQNSHNFQTIVDGLTVNAQVNQTSLAAIWVNYTEAARGMFSTGVFKDVTIDGQVSLAHQYYWKYGIHCTGCDQGLAHNVTINGVASGSTGSGWSNGSQMNVGLLIDGGTNAGVGSSAGSNGFVQDHVQVFDAVIGTQFMDDSEGPVVSSGNYVGVNHGVYAPNGANWPSFFVSKNAFACYADCVYFAGYQQGQIVANYILKRPDSTQNFTCVVIADNVGVGNSIGNSILGNACQGLKGTAAGGTATGVSIGNATDRTSVQGNNFYALDYVVNGNNGSGYQIITGNSTSGTIGAWFTGINYQSLFKDNFPATSTADLGWCAATGATPNVSTALPCKTFLLSQSGATNVTSLANAQIGQPIYLTVTDSNTTFVNSSSLLMLGGANYTATNGDAFVFLKESATVTREISRTPRVALTGDVTGSGVQSFAATLATVNSNVGTYGSATQASQVTVNAKGLVTAAGNVTVTPAVGSITGLGTGVATALGNGADAAGGVVRKGARINSRPSNPASTSSATLTMAGLAVSFTPTSSGSAIIIITGDMANSAASAGVTVQLRYGTGVAPSNGAAVTGTALTNVTTSNHPANAQAPFSLVYYVTGLTPSTAYWLDIAQATVGGGTANVYDLNVSAAEL
jgi:hypothetical protein